MTTPAGVAGSDASEPQSLWSVTAIAAPKTTSLRGAQTADVLVIGAGFTGLVAALRLAMAGKRVAVIDAAEIGWGASGRNNGQVIPGLKLDPSELVSRFGSERGEAIIAWSGACPSAVFSLIKELKIDCAPVQSGWIQPAYTTAAMEGLTSRCAAWAARGADVRMLEKSELDAMLGTPAFVGGWLDRRGGSIQPLSYARGLGKAALSHGVSIYTRTAARSLRRERGRWVAGTDEGSVAAEHVIVATAAYSGSLVPGLSQSFVPVRTAQVATAPLPKSVRDVILPGGHVASDTRRLLTSMRISPDGRLVMGGSGATGGPHSAHLEGSLHRAAREIFGHLPPFKWEFGWSGYLAVTTDHLPHIHEPGEGMHVVVGCNGRGIAISTGIGQLVADRILGASAEGLPLPIGPIRKVPFHRFRNMGIAAGAAIKRRQDASERARTRARMRRAQTSKNG